jgi:hypothetical protein
MRFGSGIRGVDAGGSNPLIYYAVELAGDARAARSELCVLGASACHGK